MKGTLFASVVLATLKKAAWPVPSCCPYCPGSGVKHWICWGFYKRYAVDGVDTCRRVAIQRFFCKLTSRTFSLLPDSLLPYHTWRTSDLLRRLYALCVERTACNTLARREGVGRATLQQLKRRFLLVVPRLRLPRCEVSLTPAAFLTALAALPLSDLAALFRGWKELQPKLSLVGIYPR